MHDEIGLRIDGLLEDETDWVAAMATVVCEL
ncbi:MAG: GAF domain-containing protein, partial [Planctomycetia bacterium]|nr:GAF domain-containing protein [Planctomycetia bacterium]